MRILPRFQLLSVLCAYGVFAVVAATASSAIQQGNGSFAVDLSLSKPVTVGPANDSQLTYPTDPVKLTWKPVPGATTYDAQVATQSSATVDCDSREAWAPENILFTHVTPELGWAPEQTDVDSGSGIWTGIYCWRVRPSGASPGTWSTSPRFSLVWPATPRNLRFYSDENGDVPRSGTADTVGFDTGFVAWDAVAGAPRYEVQLSESPTFSAASIFATKVYPGTRMLLPQMPDNNYTWRVRPIAANGIRGTWSDAATFTIQRDTRYWTTNPASLHPANDAEVNDIRVGWEPVPGASFYRYMASTSISGFTELETTDPYGEYNPACGVMNNRLSGKSMDTSSTINNWVTFAGLFDPEVQDNMLTWCSDAATRAPIPSRIHWRVYPVWQLSSATETGWTVPTRTIVGSPVQRFFDVDPYDATATTAAPAGAGGIGMVDNDSCVGSALMPGQPDCLRLIGGSMSPLNPTINSSTMQVPFFEWGAYAHRYATDSPMGGNGDGPGSFRVQVSRDSAFNNIVKPATSPDLRGWIANRGPAKLGAWATTSAGMTRYGSVTRSFALTTGLPDEGQDGNGYFWRSIPCQTGADDNVGNTHMGAVCSDYYTDAVGAGQSPGITFGTPGSGALEFRKRVEVSTQVIDGFIDTTPMLRVGPLGASSFADWQRGVQGADHYEFELARSSGFDASKVLKTTVPRIAPWGATPEEPLEAGTWFWRVRAVDRDKLAGTWSATSSFSVAAQSPTPSTSSTTAGVGGLVEWSRVPGAIEYEIAWSTDTTFNTGVSTASTVQAAYFLPSTAPGAFAWRVRAKTGATAFGPWSSSRTIQILAPTRISSGTSATVLKVGGTVIVEGQLVVAGATRNNQVVELQRKTTSCTTSGRYAKLTQGTTGKNVDDGVVRFRVKPTRSACYRFAWKYAAGTIHSAAFEIGARPVVSFRPTRRSVKRGQAFCSRIVSRQALTGTMRVQYKVGKVWVTARTQPVRSMKRRTQCAAINRGGVFPVRLVLENLRHPSAGYKLYETTTVGGGYVKTADTFVIVR